MRPGLLVVCFTLVLSSSTFAHHSATATYVHGQVVKIEGTVRESIYDTMQYVKAPISTVSVEAE